MESLPPGQPDRMPEILMRVEGWPEETSCQWGEAGQSRTEPDAERRCLRPEEDLDKENPMRINGWQRLWLLASILWAAAILLLAGILQFDGSQTVPSASEALFVARLWIVPVATVYGMGLGLAWVRRGFHVEAE
jgi:hypothetical protein